MSIVFKVNRKIEIYSLDNKKIGNSTVQDEDENHIFISIPIGENGYGDLKPAEKIKAMYCGEELKVFSFVSEIKETIKDQILLVKISKPEEYETIQRRQFVRIPLMIDIEYLVMEEEEMIDIGKLSVPQVKSIYKNRKWKQGYTYDLSAGGAGVVLKEALKMNEKVICLLRDGKFQEAVTGEVIRVSKNEQARNKLYRSGISFQNLDLRSEEKIVQYIFRKMREQLKIR